MIAATIADSFSHLIRSGAPDLIRIALKQLGDQASVAQEKYQKHQCSDDNDLETKRMECLRGLSEIRNRAALATRNRDLQQRVLCLAMEQTINTYEAVHRYSLDIVSVNTEQLRAALDAGDNTYKKQLRTRLVGVLVSVLSLIGIGAFLWYAHSQAVNSESLLPFLGIPGCVIFWSAIGSFASILYRFSNAGDAELEDPLRWLFSRPLTGIIMGAMTFLILKAGLLTVTQDASVVTKMGGKTNEVVWLIAFLAGFSDRFSDSLLRSLVGKLGGDKTGELLSMRTSTSQTATSDFLSTSIQHNRQAVADNTHPANSSTTPAPNTTTTVVQNERTLVDVKAN